MSAFKEKAIKKLLKFFRRDDRKLEHLKKDIDIVRPESWRRVDLSLRCGLSTDEAIERLHMYGPNKLTPPYTTPTWIKLLRNLFGMLQCSLEFV
ncbi:cation transporter/ATPase [Oesophagostomum dentatum]|uniref:Cation transporter/ATPase n=1 Tax=Oesophagostomum dentatum TaxID=61180 RepID=A0A0B1SJ60_OESDE|nr:cation transporter/ATPase [Oesophagostomum dentatum]